MKPIRLSLVCLLLGCAGADVESTSSSSKAVSPSPIDLAIASEPEPEPDETRWAALPRGFAHHANVGEVWIDAKASAVLSLDVRGGVRLWPFLPPAHEDPSVLAPIRVPLREPAWLSFGRAESDEFVIAAIDTVQSTRVIAIRVDADGVARVRERFTIAPTDPLLEIHVLDGGDRLLALGVDHRIRLYDGEGTLLDDWAESGVAPWQLRVTESPEVSAVAMLLTGPVRMQRLSIAEDRIAPVGNPHPFTTGRGPNRNDLVLLPSGRTAALLRRPAVWTARWSLELHDLETGEVRVAWGEVESKRRPRMHVIDEDRALLEDGSGSGFEIDLRAAVPMPEPFELPTDLDDLPPQSRVPDARITLAGSTPDARRTATVVAGLRVAAVGKELILDPIAGDRHHRLGHLDDRVHDLALAPDGSRLARIRSDGAVVVESLIDADEHPSAACTVDKAEELAFTDADHLLVIGSRLARICDWRNDESISELALPKHSRSHIRVRSPGSGTLGITLPDVFEGVPSGYSSATFDDHAFGPLEDVPEDDDGDEPATFAVIDASGWRYVQTGIDNDSIELHPPKGRPRDLKLFEDPVRMNWHEPSPDGRWLALTWFPKLDPEFEGYSVYLGPYGHMMLGVWSLDGDKPELLWSTLVERSWSLAWAADGSRFAFDDSTGIRVVTPQGEDVVESGRRDFHLDELPDAPPPKP